MSQNDKKNMYYIIILVLTLLIFVVASTFAYYSMSASKKDNSTNIYTGTVAISYEQGTLLQGMGIKPAKGEDGKLEPTLEATENVYKNTFTVSNNGTLSVILTISLNISNNSFSDGALKYIIFDKDGRKIKNGSLTKTGNLNLIDNLYLEANQNGKYTIMIWLPDDGTNQNSEINKNFSGNISVNAIHK